MMRINPKALRLNSASQQFVIEVTFERYYEKNFLAVTYCSYRTGRLWR